MNSAWRYPLLVLAFGSACSGATAVPDEPAISRMELRIDDVLMVTVQANGAMTGTGLRVGRNVPSSLQATFRDADGRVVADEADFRLEFVADNAAVLSFTRTAAKRGTLTGSIISSTTARLRLHHVSRNHDDFSERTVAVAVQ